MKTLLLFTVCALLIVVAAPAFAQDATCAPIPIGEDGVFFLKPTETCPASAYATADTTNLPVDDYVVVADMVRVDDTTRELLVLVRPFTLNTYTLGQVMTRLMRDGGVDGLGTWQDLSTTQDRG